MITPQEHTNNLVAAAYHRELEFYQYQLNIDNYNVMLEGLPNDNWPDNIITYRNTPTEQLPDGLDDTIVNLVSNYQYRDRIRNLLRTEKVEQGKTGRVRDALRAQIGDNYDTLLADYKASKATAQ